MLIIWGTRFYGRIRQCGGSFLATKFFHIWFIPLIPVGTHLVFSDMGDSFRGVEAPFSFKSVMAGYLRIWGPIAFLFALLSTIGGASGAQEPLEAVVIGAFGGLVTVALLAAVICAYAVIGKLSLEEKKQRAVYALHTGVYVDPAEMGNARGDIRNALFQTIQERARGLAAMGYRLNADPSQAWPHIALDPTQNDEALITSAFTLARLEASAAQGPWKTQMEQVHGHLWQRIQSANPPYLHAAANL
jgi:hypothetical protein